MCLRRKQGSIHAAFVHTFPITITRIRVINVTNSYHAYNIWSPLQDPHINDLAGCLHVSATARASNWCTLYINLSALHTARSLKVPYCYSVIFSPAHCSSLVQSSDCRWSLSKPHLSKQFMYVKIFWTRENAIQI